MVNTKENFCPTCALLPLAIAGVGTSAVNMSEKKKKRRMFLIRISMVISILSLLLFIYYKFLAPCKSCTQKQ